jgi:hypothetical protein
MIKGGYLALYTATLLSQENANLYIANKKKRQKR